MAVSFSYILQYGDILIYIVPSLVVYCLVVIFWIVFISSVKEFRMQCVFSLCKQTELSAAKGRTVLPPVTVSNMDPNGRLEHIITHEMKELGDHT